jgi:hypothetical protein
LLLRLQKEIVAAYEIEQFATQEAIAHAEAAEADNDRLQDTIESLQVQLEEHKGKSKGRDAGPLVSSNTLHTDGNGIR